MNAPEEYWKLTPEEKALIVNGCGPKGYGYLIPDTNWGLKITPVCNIHDYQYSVGTTEKERKEADNMFLSNHIEYINEHTKGWYLFWLRRLRYARAITYYQAVRELGEVAFYAE